MTTKNKILQGAREHLLKKGQAGFTVRAIAAQAGVNQGLVHHYFGSKENLVLELIDDITRQPRANCTHETIGNKPEDIQKSIKEHLLFDIDFGNLLVEIVSLSQHSDLIREKIREIMQERKDLVTGKLGITDTVEKTVFFACVYGLLVQSRIIPTISVDDGMKCLFKKFNLL